MGLLNFRKTPDNSSNDKNNTQKTSLLRTKGFEYLNNKEIYLIQIKYFKLRKGCKMRIIKRDIVLMKIKLK